MKSLVHEYVFWKYSLNTRLPRLSPVVRPDGAAEYEPNKLVGVTFSVKHQKGFLPSSSGLVKPGVTGSLHQRKLAVRSASP